MDLIQEKFSSVFSEYEVTTQARPDGGILLTLRDKEGKVTVDGTTYNSANIVRRAHRTEAEFATMREVASRFPGAVTIPE